MPLMHCSAHELPVVDDDGLQDRRYQCRLGFEVGVVVGKTETCISLHWREGSDPLIFESLKGYLQGKLKATDQVNTASN